ncbi:MAG: ATPase [Prevotellaceae bacterium]|jgi:N-acetylglucosamine kinase-like BadF-type ATPase|nr:ATPase [Prevotellaceae bacterium]
MKLIADSGSTKTDWRLIDGGKIVEEIQSSGINPFFQDEKEIRATIEPFYEKLKTYPVQHVFFYGAGCSFEDKKLTLKHTLSYFFPMANIEIQSDMLGVARALLGKGAGIACILGTGSNSCFYDGNEITKNVSSLGFMLGDEGSGATLGRLFISDLLKNQLPENLKNRFFETTKTTPEEIMENVYRKPFPNRYLADFTHFLAENIADNYIKKLLHDSFVQFFERNVKQYDYRNVEVHFVGSVAFYFKEILKESAKASGIKIGRIEQNPMEGLVKFHC